MRATIRNSFSAVAVVAIGLFALRAAALPLPTVDFRLISQVDESLPQTPAPAVNNFGVVAFAGARDGSPRGVFSAVDSLTVTTVDDGSGPLNLFRNLAVNASADVAYLAQGAGAAVLLQDGATKTIVDAPTFTGFGSPIGLNDNGSVAVIGATGGVPGVYVGDGVSPTTALVDTGDGFTQFPGGVALNNAGRVAFVAATTPPAPGVFITDGVTTAAITEFNRMPFVSIAPSIALNEAGVAAFVGSTASLSGIFTGVGGPADLFVSNAGPYATFGNVAISDLGGVAFEATLDDNTRGVFFGPDPVADKLIAVGDPLFGSSVADVRFGSGGLGNGTFAFAARLDDGRTVIARGDFGIIPEPGTLLLAAAGLIAAPMAARRR